MAGNVANTGTSAALKPMIYGYCGVLHDYLFNCKETGWSESDLKSSYRYCVRGWKQGQRTNLRPSEVLDIIQTLAGQVNGYIGIITEVQGGNYLALLEIDPNTIGPMLKMAMKLYLPVYAGFVCTYFSHTPTYFTDANSLTNVDNNCGKKTQRYALDAASGSVDLYAWTSEPTDIYTGFLNGNMNVFGVFDCFGMNV